jgi:CRP/FNR family transcriptional regulator, cyclic AMP receptor protein
MSIGKGIRVIFHYLYLMSLSNINTMLDKNFLNLALFSGFDRDQIRQVVPILESCIYSKDTLIFQQGSEASFFYILLSGEVIVKYKPYDGESLVIGHICPEDLFGWSAALGRPTYTSSAYAVLPCEAVRISVAQMRHFCDNNPVLGRQILERMASGIAFRLKSTYDEVLGLLSRGMDLVTER